MEHTGDLSNIKMPASPQKREVNVRSMYCKEKTPERKD